MRYAIQLLVDDRYAPVNLEPGTTPMIRWRYVLEDVGCDDAERGRGCLGAGDGRGELV